MPPEPTETEIRWNSITASLTVTANTLEILSNGLVLPFLEVISKKTWSLLKCAQTVKQNKKDCTQLLENTHEVLKAIIALHVTSNTGGDLSPSVSTQIGKFIKTLQKIHAFVETQQSGGKVKKFFRQGETSKLLKDCIAGLQDGLDFFQIKIAKVEADVTKMQDVQETHQKVVQMIEALSNAANPAQISSMNRVYSGSYSDSGSHTSFNLSSRQYYSKSLDFQSSTSLSMLPSEPKIFHGRQSELANIFELFNQETPRIAILGAGGIGKTSLARAVVHHPDISTKFGQYRYFVPCESAATEVELAALIGAHIGLTPGKVLTQQVVQHFFSSPRCLLILDDLGMPWECAESRGHVEEFLSLLTNLDHLALMITMRGTERPAKVHWSRPFLLPLKPLDQRAARQTFIEIADSIHNPEEVDKVLCLADNLPLAISLLAHLVDSEGCSAVLSRWETEKASLMSVGSDKRSNLDISISLSVSSPRITSEPQSQELLSLLSMLPDGLSDVELVQSKFPIKDIYRCKTALLSTSLAYIDENKQLKAFVLIREYMQKMQPPGDHMIRPLLKHFQELLMFYMKYAGKSSGFRAIAQIISNHSNIQKVLQNGLHRGDTDLKDSIYCTCFLNSFSRTTHRGIIPLITQIQELLPLPNDPRLEVYFITELFNSSRIHPISNPETLISQALVHLNHFEDSDLECKFYTSLVYHYMVRDMVKAINFCQKSLSLSVLMGNTDRQSYALFHLAQLKWYLGDYATALKHAYESRRLAKISEDLYTEALALQVETACWTALGNYNQSIALCSHGRALLALCGMSGGEADHSLMTSHAEVHKFKSEYIEAHSIHNQILEEVSMQQDPYAHGLSLLNLAEIDVSIGTLRNDVQRNIDTAKSIFTPIGYLMGIQWCDILQAGLGLSHAENMVAHRVLQDGVKFSRGRDSEMLFHCLERLADVSCWRTVIQMSTWTTVFLAHSIKSNRKPAFHKALQYLGDAFLARGDEDTAISLFIVALEAFTHMGVHCSQAECMLRLGDISERHGDLLKAVEHWQAARPLFERSSQARKVKKIDERLAGIKSPKKNSSSGEEEETSDPSSYSDSDYTGKSQPSNLEATKDKEVVDDLTAPSTTRATNSRQATSSSFRISKAKSSHSQAASIPPVSDFNQAEEIKTGTFTIYSPHDEKPEQETQDASLRTQDVSFTGKDLTYSQANLGVGGCLISVHEPAEAASRIEDNWHNPLLAFIRNSGCGGPFAWMLSPAEPALAIFGSFDDPIVVNMADSLADLSGFPAVIRPSSDNPALTLLSRETDPQNGFVQSGGAASNNEETRSDGDDEANTFENENTPGDSEDGGRRDDDLDRAGSDNHGLSAVDEYKRHHGYKGGQEAGDGDGDGGGPTSTDGKWESQLHRTRVKLRLKLNAFHTYAVTIGYTFKFTINGETEIPIDFRDITRPLSQPEVVAFVDFKIETRPRETQVDRSYASIGFVAHRRKSIIEREFMHRGFDLPDKLYKHGQHQQIQRGIKAALGFSQGSPLATATVSCNQNNDAILEVTDSKAMPRCRVDYETGDEWDEGNKSYSSYNIAYQLQGMRLDAERSEFYPLEVRVGMGINLHPAGSEKPLPQISFINRNQVLIWISDPTSKTRIRGIVVLMNSYLDNIRTEEKLTINEQEEIDLKAGPLNKPQTKQEQHEPGTISLSIARVQNQSATGPNKFGAAVPAFIAKLGQRSSAAPPTCIPPDEYLARGWDVHNNEWRSVLWPALDKHFRAAALERTSPVWNIRCQWKQAQQAITTNIQP